MCENIKNLICLKRRVKKPYKLACAALRPRWRSTAMLRPSPGVSSSTPGNKIFLALRGPQKSCERKFSFSSRRFPQIQLAKVGISSSSEPGRSRVPSGRHQSTFPGKEKFSLKDLTNILLRCLRDALETGLVLLMYSTERRNLLT